MLESSSVVPGTCPGCHRPLGRGAADGLCVGCLLGPALQLASQTGDSDAGADLIAVSGLEGRTLGGYEILSTLARGGMGVVFKARQRNPSRIVALKVISAGELATRRMVERFHNEALAAARLDHPNIVPIHEVGEDRGWHYFSMQLVEGRTLADLIREARPEPHATAALLVKLARAVEHAHQRGILHRDLKPTNILLDAQGEPHLTDFGLAKVSELDSDLTHTHAVLGTPAYMSPEQAAGKSRDITTATDVYGLGAIFYELLSGRPPFKAESTPELLRKVAEEEPASLKWEAGSRKSEARVASHFALPTSHLTDLSVICLKCLEKTPAKRYATAGELADDLERWLRHEPIRARSATSWERSLKWVRRNRARAALVATLVVAGFALTAVSLLFNVRLNRARQQAEANADRTRAALVRNQLGEASRLIQERRAFAALWPALEAMRLGGGEPETERSARRRIAGVLAFSPRLLRIWSLTAPASELQFSEDGQVLVAASARGDRQAWALDPPRELSPADVASQRFATNTTAVNNLGPVTQARSRSITNYSGRLGEDLPRDVAIQLTSPDGAWSVSALFDATVRVTRLRDSQPLGIILAQHASVTALAMSGDSRLLAVGSADGVVRVWDLAGPPGRMLDHPLPVDRPIFLPDQPGVMIQAETNRLALIDPQDGQLLAGPFGIPSEAQMVVRTGDGRRMATTCTNGFLGVWEVATGRRLWERQLDPEWYSLDFSPDHRRLAVFGSNGALRCFQVDDGVELFAGHQLERQSRRVEWSGDGRWLLTTSQDGLRLWDAATWKLREGPIGGGQSIFTARFSPDSRRVAATFAGSQFEPSSALVWELPSLHQSGPALSHGDALRDLRFSGDGRRMVTTSLDNSARLWWSESGSRAGPPMRHAGPVNSATFSLHGELLVTGSSDRTVRLWETATGEALAPPLLLPGPVQDAELDRSERFLAIRVNGWPGWVFEFPPETRAAAELAELASLLTGEEPVADGGPQPMSSAELARRFAAHHARKPADFAWPTDGAEWHRQQAALAERAADWPAAVFHLERLLRHRPTDAVVTVRLEKARAQRVK